MEIPTLQQSTILTNVCAWCDYLINEEGEREEHQFFLTPDHSISHGICIICADENF